MSTKRTALITGATSGLGREAAGLFAKDGYSRVIVTGRTYRKLQETLTELRSRAPHTSFDGLVLDLDDLSTVEEAVEELAGRGVTIDALILNAGIAPTREVTRTVDGYETVLASSLIGHHVLTMGILRRDLLASNARIVIAGSEAARGDVPTFNPVDIEALAEAELDGDLPAAVSAYLTMNPPAVYRGSDVYATAKQFVVWWGSELAKLLPDGTTVNTVSPGSTPDTNALRDAPPYMRYVMVPLLRLMPGASHSVTAGAGRYIEAVSFPNDVSGQFFASPGRKMTGRLTLVTREHLDRPRSAKALWDVLVKQTGGVPLA